MNDPRAYTFTRYLAAKKTVDDRALNAHAWQAMVDFLASVPEPQILEVGAGIGTMVERLVERGAVSHGRVTAIDNQPDNITIARQRLARLPAGLALELETADLVEFAARAAGQRRWDLLIAHAVLDLLDIPATLPPLFGLLKPGGCFYFTINFDGVTLLQPTLDPAFDAHVETLYHRTMDERPVARGAAGHGRVSGGSRSGRHLFGHLRSAGAEILVAGSSDWVVFAGPDGYPADEAYFLHFIIHTLHGALVGHPDLDASRFDAWIAQRHAQIDAGKLVYIAHQLDFFGRI